MTVLRFAQQNNAFNAWFARINNVVVRYLPYATAFFTRNFIANYYLEPQNATGVVTMQTLVRDALTLEANNYAPPANPNFLVLAGAQCLTDLQQLDVPIYYYRIGMLEIVDSSGTQVPIPATVTINNPAPPPATIAFPVVINRATFLANAPATAIVDAQQVQVLGGALGAYTARVNMLQTSIVNALAVAGIDPRRTIPVN
jgi:hypothetical protein